MCAFSCTLCAARCVHFALCVKSVCLADERFAPGSASNIITCTLCTVNTKIEKFLEISIYPRANSINLRFSLVIGTESPPVCTIKKAKISQSII